MQRCVARLEHGEQQEHQSDEQKDVREVTDAVDTKHAEQPHEEQTDRNLEEHLASGRQPGRSTSDRQAAEGCRESEMFQRSVLVEWNRRRAPRGEDPRQSSLWLLAVP